MRANRFRSTFRELAKVAPRTARGSSGMLDDEHPVIPIGTSLPASSRVPGARRRSYLPEPEHTTSAIAIAAGVGMLANLVAGILFATGFLG